MKIGIVFFSDYKFKIGLDVLFYSLNKYNSIKHIDKILLTDEIKDYSDFKVINIDTKKYKNIPLTNPRFAKTYYKLECFKLTDYDRIIFFDTDMLCLGPIDYLLSDQLNKYSLYGVLDNGIIMSKDRINTGLLVINKPLLNDSVYNEMLNLAEKGLSYDGSDQGIINTYLSTNKIKIGYLPMKYNMLKRIYKHHFHLWSKLEKDIRIIHFVGQKPWHFKTFKLERGYFQLERLWIREYKNAVSFSFSYFFTSSIVYLNYFIECVFVKLLNRRK